MIDPAPVQDASVFVVVNDGAVGLFTKTVSVKITSFAGSEQLPNVTRNTYAVLSAVGQTFGKFRFSTPGAAVLVSAFATTGPFTKKIETDTDFTSNKFMVIPGLTPGESYHFKVVVTDRSGNVAESPEYNVLAPARQVSLLDLIFGQLRMNFGWLTTLGQ